MRKMKKAVALALVLCFVLAMLPSVLAAGSSYSDVPADASYAAAIELLTEQGIMNGIGKGEFGPREETTRAHAITVLGRLAGAEQKVTHDFSDVPENEWYAGYVGWAVENGIVNGVGNGKFEPNEFVTSEHLNLMLTRYARLIGRDDLTFHDTALDTVTRADLAQRIVVFLSEKPADPEPTPETTVSVPALVHLDGTKGKFGFGEGYIMGYEDNGVYTFKNIPYGEHERFMSSTPVKAYGTKESPLVALNNGPVSPQQNTLTEYVNWAAAAAFMPPSDSDMFSIESECLNLNVWTDSLDSSAKKPVLVFMHGGGTENGSAIELSMYEGNFFAEYTNVVFVSVNARLNYLGYLDMSALGGDYNQGLGDMVLSLEWVKDNIATFGGDPDNVTILGQSGGGTKVSALASSPKALKENLFQKVVICSGFGASAAQPGTRDRYALSLAEATRETEAFVTWYAALHQGETIDVPASTKTEDRLVKLVDGKLPKGVDRSKLYISYWGYMMPVAESDWNDDGSPKSEDLISALNGGSQLYERVTIDILAATIAISGDATWNDLCAAAGGASNADVFSYLQTVDYNVLYALCGSNNISTGMIADGELFDASGSLTANGLNETAKNYTYLIGSAWAEMGGKNSADAVLGLYWDGTGAPGEAVCNLTDAQKKERMEQYLANRVGNYDETKAAFEKAYPNHDFYDLRALQTTNFDNNTYKTMSGLVKEGKKVYNYFTGYTMPYFGGMTMIHTADLAYFFHSIETSPYMIHGDEANAWKVADTMASSLAAFCATGDPSIEGLAVEPMTTTQAHTVIYDVLSRCVTPDFNAELRDLLKRN